EDNAQYRAAAEAALAASLVLFLGAFRRVNLWSAFARTLFLVWVVAQLAIVAVAVLDPRLAATVARLSLGFVGAFGFTLILVLALRGLDRALALMPTWILFLVWLFGAAVTLTGRMAGEFAISGLVAGLVLILVLIGFTVTQYAFRTGEPLLGSSTGGQQMRLAALDRAGVAFWEWNLRRDEVRVDAEVEALLGLAPGELPTRVEELLAYVHPADRERFRQELLAIREQHGGTLHTGIRLRHADSSYRWLQFEGASVPTSDRRNLRCVGLVRDTTDQKRAQERLLLNAVFDSLTSLPNRELFLDRLSGILHRTAGGAMPHVTVIVVDVDRFRSVNATFGLVVGDSIILTVSRRLARIAGSDAALARVGGDQFALFLVDQTDPRELASFAERLRLSLRSPIRIAGQEIVLTGSIGIAVHDGRETTARELMRDAEIAMHRAKRLGSDRAEIFGPQMQTERAERAELERDLAKAIDEARLTVLWQPVVSLANDELVGFEATVRWQHPKLGVVSPVELAPLAERADLVTRLGAYLLGQVLAGAARWQQELPRPEHPLFVTVSLTSRQLLSPELIQEIRQAKARTMLPAGSLRLAIPETLVMDNPEQASHVLELLREAGVELWMDRFGTGYSSLAYLGRFPFDAFKIDKALVEWSGQGERDAALVRSIVAVAFELGRKVVGDGVGNAEDAAFLRSIGCHYAQGFHYGDPMRDEEVVRLLRLIRSSERRMRRRGMVRGQEKKKGVEAVPDIPATITTLPPAETPAPQGSGAYPFTGQPSAAPYPSGNGSAQPPFAGGPVTGHPQTGRPQPAMQAPPPQQRVPPASPSAPPGAMRADPGTRPGPLQPDPVSRPIHAAVPPATGAQGAMPAPQAMSGKGFTPQPQQPPPQAPSQTGKSGVTLGGAPAAHGSASSVSRPADVAAPRPMTRPAPPQPTVRASDLPHPMPERPAAPPSQPQSGLSRGEQAAAVAAAREAAAMQPQLTDPETSSRTSRQHTRRTGPALSPAVAASLARLAGKSEGSAAHNPDAPGPAPGGRSGVKAAE
ncbi:MAG: EAL domain-containing protein, partial [Hyphomicrobiaceae bacterium]